MRLHRICKREFGESSSAAFSGQGGVVGSGRWHQRGHPVVYTSMHRSLALLEIRVHLDSRIPVADFVAWEIEIPDELIQESNDLPGDWNHDLEVSRDYGTEWLLGRKSVALQVPSVIVPVESNVLLNPMHREFDFGWVKAGPIPIEIDRRLI